MDTPDGLSFEIVHPGGAPARVAIERYFAELDERFHGGFDPAHGGAGRDEIEMLAPHGAFVVVTDGDTVVGCGGVQRIDNRTAEIKRMWIDPTQRGQGLGRRLLDHLEQVARELGRTRVVLDTNEVLTEAVTMYERAGYRPVDRYNENPYAHHWFAKEF